MTYTDFLMNGSKISNDLSRREEPDFFYDMDEDEERVDMEPEDDDDFLFDSIEDFEDDFTLDSEVYPEELQYASSVIPQPRPKKRAS